MAEQIVKFNNKEYHIDESKFDPSISRLATYLANELAGTGATVTFDSNTYNIDVTKMNAAAAGFTNYLDKISGDDYAVVVNDETYGLSKAPVDSGYETVRLTLSSMTEPEEPDSPAIPQLPASQGLKFELVEQYDYDTDESFEIYRLIGRGTCTDLDIVIPDEYEDITVTEIGSNVFSGENINSIIIPNSIQYIHEEAFSNCENLENIYINKPKYSLRSLGPWGASENCIVYWNGVAEFNYRLNADGQSYGVASWGDWEYGYSSIPNTYKGLPVTAICDFAFNRVNDVGYEIIAITLPDSIIEIGSEAFSNQPGMDNIILSKNLEIIGIGAFSGCSGLTSIEIPNSVTSIGSWVFSGCSGLTSIEIPNSVMSIGGWAFYDCIGLKGVTIGNSVTSIGNSAFSGCSGLKSVTIGNSVTSIGEYAFADCSGLTSIEIPNSVTSIGERAFMCCSGLTSMTFNGTIAEWNAIEKGDKWNESIPATYVQCTDGQVAL